jgi:siroheme synthase (precorrin-2 oxidase/ferrochelatase)
MIKRRSIEQHASSKTAAAGLCAAEKTRFAVHRIRRTFEQHIQSNIAAAAAAAGLCSRTEHTSTANHKGRRSIQQSLMQQHATAQLQAVVLMCPRP